MRQISVNLCLSIGMTMVIVAGGIDLSVGSILALAGAITAGLIKHALPIPWLGVELEFTVHGAILAGLLVGHVPGVVQRANDHPGAHSSLCRDPRDAQHRPRLDDALDQGVSHYRTRTAVCRDRHCHGAWHTRSRLDIGCVWSSCFVVVTKKTRFGRYIYAVGGNERTAKLSGLNVDRIKVAIYTLAGGLSAVAGLIVTSRLDSAQPNAGTGYELDSIAAVVIGGTSLSGGRGSILGTVIGCLIIGVLNSGLVLLDVSPFWQQVVKGGVILLAVAIDRLRGAGDTGT